MQTLSLDTPLRFAGTTDESRMPMDLAVDAALAQLGLPLLGGPSGSGWSKYSVAQTCPYLFQATYELGDGHERTYPDQNLQVGGLYHALIALYYAYALGANGGVRAYRRGLIAPQYAARLADPSQAVPVRIPADAPDQLLARLKWMAAQSIETVAADPSVAALLAPPSKIPPLPDLSTLPAPDGFDPLPEAVAGPDESLILQAERVFDAYTEYYGRGHEDVRPLAVEWHAAHPLLQYTCRYDAIMRLGPYDTLCQTGVLPPGSIVIYERKTAKYLSEWAQDGWFLDGEILGQLLLWKPSGCENIFGPLAGLVVDVVTKTKRPQFARIFVGQNPVTVRAHEQGIQYQNAEIALWRATGLYPKRWVSCWRYNRKCGLYEQCRAATATEAADNSRPGPFREHET